MLSVSHYTITDKRIKKSATFAMIADLHNAEYGDKNEKLIKEIKKIAPDAVLIRCYSRKERCQSRCCDRPSAKAWKRIPCLYFKGKS